MRLLAEFHHSEILGFHVSKRARFGLTLRARYSYGERRGGWRYQGKIKGLYQGRVRVEPHHYLPETSHYLKYISVDRADRNYGMVFETEHEGVTSFRVGTRSAIALVEGCG